MKVSFSKMFFKCSLLLFALTVLVLADDDLGQYKALLTKKCTGCGPKVYRKCYHIFCEVRKNWFAANEFCNSIGMRLATIENAEQQHEVVRLMNNTVCRKESLWIGGNNLADGINFDWVPTGERITYNGWFPGKPDNPLVENCVEQLINNCGWNDKSCNVEQPIICEALSCL